jgi:hypothetical protein
VECPIVKKGLDMLLGAFSVSYVISPPRLCEPSGRALA